MEGSSLAFFQKNPDLCNCEWPPDPLGTQICLKEQPCAKVLCGTCHVGWGQATDEVDFWLIMRTLLIREAKQHIASVVIQFQEMRDHVIPAQGSWAGPTITCFAICSDLCLMTDPPHKSRMRWFIATLLLCFLVGEGQRTVYYLYKPNLVVISPHLSYSGSQRGIKTMSFMASKLEKVSMNSHKTVGCWDLWHCIFWVPFLQMKRKLRWCGIWTQPRH